MTKPKSIHTSLLKQTLLLPSSPIEWLPAYHVMFSLLELPAKLNFELFLNPSCRKNSRSEKGFDQRMKAKASAKWLGLQLLYAYCEGNSTSRKIERACCEETAFRVLNANQQPDHNRISEFHRRHLGALQTLFLQVLRLGLKPGIVNLAMWRWVEPRFGRSRLNPSRPHTS
ncbi:MAG: transposase [Prochlorococcaceae cyanobacterium]